MYTVLCFAIDNGNFGHHKSSLCDGTNGPLNWKSSPFIQINYRGANPIDQRENGTCSNKQKLYMCAQSQHSFLAVEFARRKSEMFRHDMVPCRKMTHMHRINSTKK